MVAPGRVLVLHFLVDSSGRSCCLLTVTVKLPTMRPSATWYVWRRALSEEPAELACCDPNCRKSIFAIVTISIEWINLDFPPSPLTTTPKYPPFPPASPSNTQPTPLHPRPAPTPRACMHGARPSRPRARGGGGASVCARVSVWASIFVVTAMAVSCRLDPKGPRNSSTTPAALRA